MDSSEQPRPPEPEPGNSRSGGDLLLPSLKETVGSAYNAQRPLRPHPGPSKTIPELFIPGVSVIYLDDQPIRTYEIGGALYNMAQPHNETKNEVSRVTVDNRRITYVLEVVQQPEKARACGAGAKSSTDRRPVDPPPVVRLRVYNGSSDMTMLYDSTFMLYASLEVARPIAAGKMHTPPAIPVLSGVAVASAAYLERPDPAAYFIFPDLSVRHEGWYRLRFSLFEGVKHECDADRENPLPRQLPILSNDQLAGPARHESMANRLEVQSVPFQVYSAKKFPGLNSSTDLSKHMSDQGCRVRIRRDIRQRKRTQKAEPDVEDSRSSYQGTPQVSYRTMEHSRSVSRTSFRSDCELDAARRASVESIYGRPAIQSRQGSIVSMPMASPSMSNMTPTASMPPPAYHQPPVQRSFQEPPTEAASYLSSPAAKQYQPPTGMMNLLPPNMRPVTPDHRNEFTLPPLLPGNASSSGSHKPGPHLSGLYNLQQPAPMKRARSPQGYNMTAAMKAGARPDQLPMPTYASTPLPGVNSIIEPDNGQDDGQDDEDEGVVRTELQYSTANGAVARVRTLKPVVLPPRKP